MVEKIKIIGIGDDGENGIFPKYQAWIKQADLLIGGERHLSYFSEFQQEKITIKGNLTEIINLLKERDLDQKVVVLASGDPLFYGIASLFISKLGKAEISVYPHLSSIQLMFSQIGLSWQDAYFESLHGRSISGLAQRIDGKSKVVLLTDIENTPQEIAEYLSFYRFTEYEMIVGEDLGSEKQRIETYSLDQLKGKNFSPLNIVVLKQTTENSSWTFGIEDEEFFQRKPAKGLITKKEIRVISLAEMNLQKNAVVWDIGAGSGSISVEACKLAPYGKVYAIEKTDSNLDNIKNNMQKFKTDFMLIHGSALAVIKELEAPDAVFIGGSGGDLKEILKVCGKKLKKNGRIVVNAVVLETLNDAMAAFAEMNFTTKITLAQVARSKPIIGMTRFEGLNPIYIITAHKED